MLQLINLNKNYKEQQALKNINLNLYENEVVMILGPSGCGKTTLLNLIFNIDEPTSGKIFYKNKNIQNINQDSYHSQIGYIMQNFELLDNLSVKDNISLAHSIIGKKDSNLINETISLVGLTKEKNKKVKLLSGGQKQRVAIARSIVNSPEIIIADEPTGSLDSKNTKEIMDLLIKVSKNKLLIIVTHNEYLAHKYGTRIIKLNDGVITSDSNPQTRICDLNYTKKKNKIKTITIFKLLKENILSKKLRFTLTTIAATIGLTSLALLINLSSSLNKQINNYENTFLKSFPIIINQENDLNLENENYSYPEFKDIKIKKNNNINDLSSDQIKYIDKINPNLLSGINKRYFNNIYILTKNNNILFLNQEHIIEMPIDLNNYYQDNFDLIVGTFPENKNELVLIIDGNNQIDESLYKTLNKNYFNQNFKLLSNNELFIKNNNDFYLNNNLNKMYKNGIDHKIVGIIRSKKFNKTYQSISGIGISEESLNDLLKINYESQIVKEQLKTNINILTKEKLLDKNIVLKDLNYSSKPIEITLFPKDYNSRKNIINYLDSYKDKIIYVDYAKVLIDLTSSLINSLTIVIGIFSIISLIVIVIMIGIITYITILEEKKQIGILRMLGMKKKDLIYLFNLENILIGLIASLISYNLANIILKTIYKQILKYDIIYKMDFKNFLMLLIISLFICQLGGFFPLFKLSRQKIVNNLKDL